MLRKYLAILILLFALPFSASAQALPVIPSSQLTVEVGPTWFKLDYPSVKGAADYGVYDVTDPLNVKYAGDIYSPSGTYPNQEIEIDGCPAGTQQTYVLVAYNALGLFPVPNLATGSNALVNPSLGGVAGLDMSNGQGTGTNPVAIAQSAPFVVTCPGNAGNFTEDFANAQLVPTLPQLPTDNTWTFTLSTHGLWPWLVQQQGADNLGSSIAIRNGQLVTTLADGGTQGTNNPPHVEHGVDAFSPIQTTNISGAQVGHVHEMIDLTNFSNRRYQGIWIVPANDPLIGFYDSSKINSTDRAVDCSIFDTGVAITEYIGPTSTTNSVPIAAPIFGAAGQAPIALSLPKNGRGISDLSRVDYFFTTTNFWLFLDGQEYGPEGTFPQPIDPNVEVDLTTYSYHSSLALEMMQLYAPYQTFWMEHPYIDQRDWNDMGVEVLPASTTLANMQTLSAMPPFVPVTLAGTPPPVIPPVTPPIVVTPPVVPPVAPPIKATKCAAPVVTETHATNSITLTWAAVPGAVSYNVYAGPVAGKEAGLAPVTVTGLAYTAAVSATTFLEVAGDNAAGVGFVSNQVHLTITPKGN